MHFGCDKAVHTYEHFPKELLKIYQIYDQLSQQSLNLNEKTAWSNPQPIGCPCASRTNIIFVV